MHHVDRYRILEPDRVALETPDRSLTYRELAELLSRGSGALGSRGLEPGDRVAVLARNDLPTLVALWAVPRMGGVVVPLDPSLGPSELQARIDLVEPRLVLWDDGEPSAGREVHRADSLFRGPPAEPYPHGPADLHSVFFTSGSAGIRKGVRLTWGNHEAAAAAAAGRLPLGPDDRWLVVLPLFHLGGFAAAYRTFRAGGTVVLEPSFDAQRVATCLGDVSYISVVPTMLRRLLAANPVAGPAKATLVGGAPVPGELVAMADAAGLRVARTYGLTEAASQVATALPGEGPGARPLEGVTVTAGTGPDDPARIGVDGPMVSPGYWNGPDHTGPLQTGDIGYVDEAGRLHVIGPSRGVIISGGENIHPVEVETALSGFSGVVAVAVFGVPDEEWGERVEAVLVPAQLAGELDDLIRHAREHLAPYQIPKRWHFADEVPLGSTGKVDHNRLIGQVEEG